MDLCAETAEDAALLGSSSSSIGEEEEEDDAGAEEATPSSSEEEPDEAQQAPGTPPMVTPRTLEGKRVRRLAAMMPWSAVVRRNQAKLNGLAQGGACSKR